jgi:demethylmenaquinone methyltransferase/2-methoxy-6-polyprenyl-1,4-benzoquinol methylase
VYGLDFSERMLQYARGKISRRRLAARVRLVRGDALRTPFATGKAAAISIAWGLRNLESIAGGLREMRRLAAPGGRLAVLENSRPDLPLVGSLYDLYFNRLMPRIGRAVTRASHDAYEYLARSTADFPPPERIMALMRNMGLSEIQRHPMMFGAVSLYTATVP